MRLLCLASLCAALLVLPACRKTTSDLVSGTGSISGALAECSSWYVVADSGRFFEITVLDPAFRQVGLRIRFTLRIRRDVASACMRGETAEVVSMTRLGDEPSL